MKSGNELIDANVKGLFDQLLYSKKNYYVGPSNYRGAVFNVDGTKIKLGWFKNDFCWEICPEDTSGYVFYIEILPYGRQLVVPELDRVEEAKALTQLEYLANSKELSTLEHLNKFLANDNSN